MDVHTHTIRSRPALKRAGRPAAAKASYEYRWDTLDCRTFRSIGVIARRAPDGSPRFNFPQTVWLFPGVEMDWSARNTRAVQTLAVNILTSFLLERNVVTYFGATSRRVLNGAARFADACLTTMPAQGGCISRELIEKWILEEL